MTKTGKIPIKASEPHRPRWLAPRAPAAAAAGVVQGSHQLLAHAATRPAPAVTPATCAVTAAAVAVAGSGGRGRVVQISYELTVAPVSADGAGGATGLVEEGVDLLPTLDARSHTDAKTTTIKIDRKD